MRFVNIQCPHCRRNVEVEEAQRGCRLRCPYPDCRKFFRWREDGTCVAETGPSRSAAVAQSLVYCDWRTQPPPRRLASATQMGAAVAEEETMLPSVDEPAEVSLEELRELGFTPEQLRSHSRAGWWTAVFFLVLLGITGLVGWLAFRAEQSREPHQAAEAEKLFREGQYSQALAKYRDLLRQFPGSARRGEYLFYEQACLLRALLNNPRADIHRLTQLATQFLRDFRRTAHFAQHRRDLAEALYQVSRRAIEEAKASLDRLLLEQVQEIYTALQDIGFGLGDPVVRNNELSQGIQQTDYAIRLAEARNRLQLALQAAFHLNQPTLVAQAEELFAQLRRDFPELAKEERIVKPLAQLAELESTWLIHVSWVQWQAALNWSWSLTSVPSLPVLAIMQKQFPTVLNPWQVKASLAQVTAPKEPPAKVPLAPVPVVVTEGAHLFALHGRSGRPLWTAHLPNENHLRVVRRESGRPRIYVWAQERRLLSAFELAHGRVLWTIHLPGQAPFTPVVEPPYWWLVEPNGWVWYGEVETGEALGGFWLDYPLVPTLGANPLNGLACVATHRQRIFLLDPNRQRASVLLSGHEEKSLAGPPIPLLSGICLPVARGDQMQLLGLHLPSAGSPPTTPSVPLLNWPGRRLRHTASHGESAVLITDRREIIFLQSAPNSPVPARVVGGSKWTLALANNVKSPGEQVYFVGQRLGDGWVISNGSLLRIYWDEYREQLRQETFNIPVGEVVDFAWDSQHANLLVLLLREPGGSLRVIGWDILTTSVLWNRLLSESKSAAASPASAKE